MARSVWQVRDELWQAIEPLLPRHEPGPRGGRPRVDDRVAFGAIMFVLVTGIAWRHLPAELGCSPATAHRRSSAVRGHMMGVDEAKPLLRAIQDRHRRRKCGHTT